MGRHKKALGTEIDVSKLHNAFDVRDRPKTDDQIKRHTDRVLNFAEKMETGADFPLPIVTKVGDFPGGMFSGEFPAEDFIVIDGRTRLEAMTLLLDQKTVQCEVRTFLYVWQVHAVAFKSNYGGPEPMTTDEERKIVKQLSDGGLKNAAIAEATGIPVGRVDVYISKTRAAKLQAQMKEALKAVRAGMSIKSAAKQYDVDEERIVKASRKLTSLPGLKAQATTAAKKYIHTIRTLCSHAIDGYQDDMLTTDHLHNLLDHLDKLGMDIQRSHTERRRAVDMILKSEKGTVVSV